MGNQTSKTRHAKIVLCVYAFVLTHLLLVPHALNAITITATQSLGIYAVVIDPNAPTSTPPLPGGGGGGGFSDGLVPLTKGGTVSLSGKFAPQTLITLLFSGKPNQQVKTNSDGTFSFEVSQLAEGVYRIVLIAQDDNSLTSHQTMVSYSVYVSNLAETIISNVIFPPLYYDNFIDYRQGESVLLSGKAIASTTIEIAFDDTLFYSANTDQSGYFKQYIKGILPPGKHYVSFRQNIGSTTSPFGKKFEISISSKNNKKIKKSACGSKADFSSDCRVNLIDFSILAYWHNRTDFPEKFDLNKDGKIDLKDFSILAYFWTN